SDNPETPGVSRFHLVIGECEWLPNFRAPAKLTAAAEIEKLERKIETGGHHAYNGEVFAVQKELRPDDLRIAIETTLPQSRADDHNIVAAKGAFFGLEKSAFDRRNTKQRQHACGDSRPCDPLGSIFRGE